MTAIQAALVNALPIFVGTLPLLAVIFWAAFQQNQRISRLEIQFDAMNARMQAQFDAMNARMQAQFDAMNARMQAQFDAMNARMQTQFDTMNARMQSQFDVVNAKLDKQNERITIIETKIDGPKLIGSR